jgi:hypothetical protein
MLLNQNRDDIVISHSMGTLTGNDEKVDEYRMKRSEDNSAIGTLRVFLDRFPDAQPVFLTAASNEYPSFENYMEAFPLVHTPNALVVGAAGYYRTTAPGMDKKNAKADFVVAPYTNHADICAPLPPDQGRQTNGTSNSTPLLAALMRQELEWYGNRLSPSEITAALMMSASRDVRDYTNISGKSLDAAPASFKANGGGLPHHERCGPGVAAVYSWHKMLEVMSGIKEWLGAQSSPDIQTLIGTQEVSTDAGQYVYTLTVPEDMTLTRLSFLLPQYEGRHGEITVKSPAGFTLKMQRSQADAISTHAFAYEDVKAGDIFEIRADQPLGPTAGMVLRGQKPGHAIAALRDHLRAQGTLPAPLTELTAPSP